MPRKSSAILTKTQNRGAVKELRAELKLEKERLKHDKFLLRENTKWFRSWERVVMLDKRAVDKQKKVVEKLDVRVKALI